MNINVPTNTLQLPSIQPSIGINPKIPTNTLQLPSIQPSIGINPKIPTNTLQLPSIQPNIRINPKIPTYLLNILQLPFPSLLVGFSYINISFVGFHFLNSLRHKFSFYLIQLILCFYQILR